MQRSAIHHPKHSTNDPSPPIQAEAAIRRDPVKESNQKDKPEPIPSMTNDALEESLRMRLPYRILEAHKNTSASPAQTAKKLQNELHESGALLARYVQHCHEMQSIVDDSYRIALEVGELTGRLQEVKRNVDTVTGDMETFLADNALNRPWEFLEQGLSAPPDFNPFAKGNINSPIHIDQKNGHEAI